MIPHIKTSKCSSDEELEKQTICACGYDFVENNNNRNEETYKRAMDELPKLAKSGIITDKNIALVHHDCCPIRKELFDELEIDNNFYGELTKENKIKFAEEIKKLWGNKDGRE